MSREKEMDHRTLQQALNAPARFPMGLLVITASAKAQLTSMDYHQALQRHSKGDWGDLDDEDKATNDAALKDGDRLLSAYESSQGTRFWIITEADRSVTTVLLPEDY